MGVRGLIITFRGFFFFFFLVLWGTDVGCWDVDTDGWDIFFLGGRSTRKFLMTFEEVGMGMLERIGVQWEARWAAGRGRMYLKYFTYVGRTRKGRSNLINIIYSENETWKGLGKS